VIHKYVNVNPEAVLINVGHEDGHEILELTVALPEKDRG
jgi:septum formation topological specificity factor MinE